MLTRKIFNCAKPLLPPKENPSETKNLESISFAVSACCRDCIVGMQQESSQGNPAHPSAAAARAQRDVDRQPERD